MKEKDGVHTSHLVLIYHLEHERNKITWRFMGKRRKKRESGGLGKKEGNVECDDKITNESSNQLNSSNNIKTR